MTITIEKIDLLKERAQITYSEARDLLEQFDGNVVEALIHLEQHNQTTKPQEPNRRSHHTYHHNRDGMEKARGFMSNMHKSRFILKNDENQLINLPLTIATLFTIITMPISLFLLVGTVLTGYKITIVKHDGKKVSIDKVFEVNNEKQE